MSTKTKPKEDVEVTRINKAKKVSWGSYGNYFYVHSNPSNCKLCTVDHIGRPLRNDKDTTIELVKEYIGGNLVFFVTLIKKQDIETLKEEFDMVYCNKVPIGYSGGFQYHALFVNPKTEKRDYYDRLKPELESKI